MAKLKIVERRRHPRYPLHRELRVHELSSLSFPGARGKPISAHIENISAGGLCMHASRAIAVADVLRCELQVARLPVSIPLLLRVQWVQEREERPRYRIGTQFLV